MHCRHALALLLAWALALVSAPALANHMAAELVPEGPAASGQPLTLALHFTPQPGWHGYWSNPGDAGYGMDLKWHLPEGWKAGEPQYPVPQELRIGGLMNHVYEAEYAVLVPVSVSPGAAAGPTPIALDANWLACTREVCVPEKATLTAVVRAAGARDPRFDKWRAAIPALLPERAAFDLTADELRLAIPLPASLALQNPHVFVEQTDLVDYAAPQVFRRKGDTLIAEIPRKGLAKSAERLGGILKLDDSGQG
ncbi:MAG: thiol:disulfide interchange protein, partial [Porphyrobacter sp.]|nr:thiol:disulfide interchange protein [Porphyrobacter sp.]